MKKANLISGMVLIFCSLSLLLIVIPAQIEEVEGAIFSPRLMPYVCGWIMLLLSICLIVQNVSSIRKGSPVKAENSPISKAEVWAMVSISVVTTVCMILFKYFGAAIPSAILVVAIMWLMGERRILPFVFLPTGLLLVTYLIFYKVLGTTIK